MPISWPPALAWRLRRQLLDPVGAEPVAAVVRRLVAVPAYPEDAAELAVRLRRQRSRPGEVARALAEGRLVKTYLFRGATHLVTPEDGGVLLALRAAGRQWELPSWQEYYDLRPADWPRFRETVREALADGPLTREELGAAVTARRRYRGLGFAFTDGTGSLVKALMWQGDMCFGPPRAGRATLQRLDANPRWAGVPGLDEAGPRAVASYVAAYGPATPDHLQYWLGAGLSAGRKRIHSWFTGLGDRLAEVDVDGTPAYVLREHLDDLIASVPSDAVRLLPGHDPWVLGPGTADPHVVPPARRPLVTRGANLVVAGGVVSGTWQITGDEVDVAWFAEAGQPPVAAVQEEVARLAGILDRPLTPAVRTQ